MKHETIEYWQSHNVLWRKDPLNKNSRDSNEIREQFYEQPNKLWKQRYVDKFTEF